MSEEDQEMAVAVADAEEIFHKERWRKHVRGIQEHRGGDFNAPFNGDRVEEYCAEQLDSVNYLEQDLRDGKISQAEFDYQAKRHFEGWWWRRQRG